MASGSGWNLWVCLVDVVLRRYRISLNKSLPRINAGSVYTPGVNWAAKLINAGSQIDAGGVAHTRVHTYVRDDLWPRAFYRSTATVQMTHARLFVAIAALARHAARCLPSITSLINLTLVRHVQVI